MNVPPIAPAPFAGHVADAPADGLPVFGALLGAMAVAAVGTPVMAVPPTVPTSPEMPDAATPKPVAVAMPTPAAIPSEPIEVATTPPSQPVASVPRAPLPIDGEQVTDPAASPPTEPQQMAPEPATPPAPQDKPRPAFAAIATPPSRPEAAPETAPKPVAIAKDDGHEDEPARPDKAKNQPEEASVLPTVEQPLPVPIPITTPLPPARQDVSLPSVETTAATIVASAPSSSQPARAEMPDVAAAAPPPTGQDHLPPLLASQTPAISAPAPTYPAIPQRAPVAMAVAQPGRIGRDIGVAVARHVAAGRDEVLVRLDPAELGRIDVRLSFDDKGSLRAAVSADSSVALDMLRRDAGDLGRALADAGVRSDTSSFSFESRGGGTGQSAHQQHQPHGQRASSGPLREADGGDISSTPYRPFRASGRIDLMA
jgi:flagellar hook-length control protein FliK